MATSVTHTVRRNRLRRAFADLKAHAVWRKGRTLKFQELNDRQLFMSLEVDKRVASSHLKRWRQELLRARQHMATGMSFSTTKHAGVTHEVIQAWRRHNMEKKERKLLARSFHSRSMNRRAKTTLVYLKVNARTQQQRQCQLTTITK
eukprot:GHVU01026316.1.p1 GENE.GHVU01026316.1~~GHVU01026316.1.p1  ORF type:complete len:147 (+),score=22.91 GHVU01026316.1:524-964(+)